MPASDPIVICAAKRTPLGSFLGCLSPLSAVDLGAAAIKGALEASQIPRDDISETIMGCVLPAGLGQAPARQAAIAAGLPMHAGATTINKMCGSGMKAVMLAHDSLLADDSQVIIAGGLESMSNAPYLMKKARSGYRLGHGELYDHLFLDGLEDAYDKDKLMGWFAEETAKKYHFTRKAQDDFARLSLARAKQATDNGSFANEIIPVTARTRHKSQIITHDEGPLTLDPEKIKTLKPAFQKDGTVTAANSSSISDGAAALVLMRRSQAVKRGIEPVAKILGHASYAQQPQWFTTAPAFAIKHLLEKIKWQSSRVDLYEINEAFAVVTLAAIRELGLSPDIVNINGGACALGHPIGASGARILVTLLHALQKNNLKRGIASLCIGGGEATAMAIELL